MQVNRNTNDFNNIFKKNYNKIFFYIKVLSKVSLIIALDYDFD